MVATIAVIVGTITLGVLVGLYIGLCAGFGVLVRRLPNTCAPATKYLRAGYQVLVRWLRSTCAPATEYLCAG